MQKLRKVRFSSLSHLVPTAPKPPGTQPDTPRSLSLSRLITPALPRVRTLAQVDKSAAENAGSLAALGIVGAGVAGAATTAADVAHASPSAAGADDGGAAGGGGDLASALAAALSQRKGNMGGSDDEEDEDSDEEDW